MGRCSDRKKPLLTKAKRNKTTREGDHSYSCACRFKTSQPLETLHDRDDGISAMSEQKSKSNKKYHQYKRRNQTKIKKVNKKRIK